MTTSLAPIEGSQPMDTSPIPSPTSLVVPAKITGHSKILCSLHDTWKVWFEEFTMSSDWDDDEEDQAKNKDKDNNQDHTQTCPNFSTVISITLKPLKPFINKYFDNMSNEISIVYISKEKSIYDTIPAQQELNTTKHEV